MKTPVHSQLPPQRWFRTAPLQGAAREIGLHEFDAAAHTLQSEERVFGIATAILVGLLTGSAALLAGDTAPWSAASATLTSLLGDWLAIGVILVAGLLVIVYFASRQRAIVWASRKLVFLRGSLGLRYTSFASAIPIDQVEGADSPFAIHMFHGWWSYRTIPFAVTSLVVGLVVYSSTSNSLDLALAKWELILPALALVILAVAYRGLLFERHDSWLRIFTYALGRSIGIRLLHQFESALYRAELNIAEAERLGVDISKFFPILEAVEDRRFMSHSGVDLYAIRRAIRDFAVLRKRSGGSTITQQLARTLFVESPGKNIRRKTIEILLAWWLESKFKKKEILELYISSVRFESGIYGILEANKWFFGRANPHISTAMRFFLIERLGNIQKGLLSDRIIALSHSLSTERFSANQKGALLTKDDLEEYGWVVTSQVNSGRIKSDVEHLHNLVARIASIPSVPPLRRQWPTDYSLNTFGWSACAMGILFLLTA